MNEYVVHCQALEQYGNKDEQDWYKLKYGASYLVEAHSSNNAIAYVLLHLSKINNDWWMEYPTSVTDIQDWNDYLLTLDNDYAEFQRNSLVKL